MAKSGFEGTAQAVYARPATAAEMGYARQLGLDPMVLSDPDALERLRQTRRAEGLGSTGMDAAELSWMLVNEPVEPGMIDFKN